MATKFNPATGDWEDNSIRRRLDYANALRKGSLDWSPGQMVGPHFVPNQPWVNALEGFAGGFMGSQAEADEAKLGKSREEQFAEALRKRPSMFRDEVVPGTPGAPAQPSIPAGDPGDGMMPPATAEQTAAVPAVEATPATTRQVRKPWQQQQQEQTDWATGMAGIKHPLAQALAAKGIDSAWDIPEKGMLAEAKAAEAATARAEGQANRMAQIQAAIAGRAPQGSKTHFETDDSGNTTAIITAPDGKITTQSIGKIGKTKTQAAGGGTVNDLDPDTIDFMAKQALTGDTSVLVGLGRTKGALAAVRNRMASMAKEIGISPEEAVQRGAEFQGEKAGQRALGTAGAIIMQAAGEARQMMDVTRALATKINPTEYPSLNAIKNAVDKGTGGVEIVQLNASLNALVNAYARAVNPRGVPTVSDKDHAREIINSGLSTGQLSGVLDVMNQEMDAALASPGIARKELRDARVPHSGGALPKARAAAGGSLVNQIPTEGAVEATKVIGNDTYEKRGGTWYKK